MFLICLNFDIKQILPAWGTWLERFEEYLIAADVKKGERKRALLLYQAGPAIYKMFKTLPDTVVNKDYAKAKDASTTHFEPAKNPNL